MSPARLPPAPGRLSAITGWPQRSVSFEPILRVSRPLGLPGAMPMMTRIAGLAPAFGALLAARAGQQVARSARREADDDADRSVGIVVGVGGRAGEQQERDERPSAQRAQRARRTGVERAHRARRTDVERAH